MKIINGNFMNYWQSILRIVLTIIDYRIFFYYRPIIGQKTSHELLQHFMNENMRYMCIYYGYYWSAAINGPPYFQFLNFFNTDAAELFAYHNVPRGVVERNSPERRQEKIILILTGGKGCWIFKRSIWFPIRLNISSFIRNVHFLYLTLPRGPLETVWIMPSVRHISLPNETGKKLLKSVNHVRRTVSMSQKYWCSYETGFLRPWRWTIDSWNYVLWKQPSLFIETQNVPNSQSQCLHTTQCLGTDEHLLIAVTYEAAMIN